MLERMLEQSSLTLSAKVCSYLEHGSVEPTQPCLQADNNDVCAQYPQRGRDWASVKSLAGHKGL